MNINSIAKYGYLALCYHYIRPNENDPFPRILGTKISEFEDQIKILRKNYQMISLDDVLKFSYKKSKLNIKTDMLLILASRSEN